MLRQTRVLLLACLLCSSIVVMAQLSHDDGERTLYNVNIEMPKGYVSGQCVMLRNGKQLNGTIINEFGVTVMDFVYDETKDKVKFVSVVDMLDKWYIRRVLRRDLRMVIHGLDREEDTYENKKCKIKYHFSVQKFCLTE